MLSVIVYVYTVGYVLVLHQKATTPITVNHTKYVSLYFERFYGNYRTGNQLFMLSAMLYIANLTNRQVAMPLTGWTLDYTFSVKVFRVKRLEKDLCPCTILDTPRHNFDERFNNNSFIESLQQNNQTILITGLSQTFKYLHLVNDLMRSRVTFRSTPRIKSEIFLRNARTQVGSQSKSLIQVGVHIRRGDYLNSYHVHLGFTVADKKYLKNSFSYFTSRHEHVQFVMLGNDRNWTMFNLPSLNKSSSVIFSNNTHDVDLAILSKCDAVIFSTGTFGWWGAWLANKTTIYYADWPRKYSHYYNMFNRKDYFPPHWIGME